MARVPKIARVNIFLAFCIHCCHKYFFAPQTLPLYEVCALIYIYIYIYMYVCIYT
jgi:hypothetical protein